ncbi:hypothetical protein DFH07DRAFT_1057972, partial [Mycena maculata]
MTFMTHGSRQRSFMTPHGRFTRPWLLVPDIRASTTSSWPTANANAFYDPTANANDLYDDLKPNTAGPTVDIFDTRLLAWDTRALSFDDDDENTAGPM